MAGSCETDNGSDDWGRGSGDWWSGGGDDNCHGDSCSQCQPDEVGSIEPRREKTGFLHMRKQRRRSASR